MSQRKPPIEFVSRPPIGLQSERRKPPGRNRISEVERPTGDIITGDVAQLPMADRSRGIGSCWERPRLGDRAAEPRSLEASKPQTLEASKPRSLEDSKAAPLSGWSLRRPERSLAGPRSQERATHSAALLIAGLRWRPRQGFNYVHWQARRCLFSVNEPE